MKNALKSIWNSINDGCTLLLILLLAMDEPKEGKR